MTWKLFEDPEEEWATPVREMYLEALSMRARDVPSPEIREHLVKGRALCCVVAYVEGKEPSYELAYEGGEKISFDGRHYWYWGRGPAPSGINRRPRSKLFKWSVCIGNAMNVAGTVLAHTEQDGIAAAIRKFQIGARQQNEVFLVKIGDDC